MKTRPIIFNGPMSRALREGRKTQTRRVVKVQPLRSDWIPYRCPDWRWNWVLEGSGMGSGDPFRCPYGQPGDLLWVRESLGCFSGPHFEEARYTADQEIACSNWPWQRPILPSMFMPRALSRTTLELTDVRVERVQEISTEDVRAEGLNPFGSGRRTEEGRVLAREAFCNLWDSINAKRGYGWDANPWVWALTFKVHQCNVHELLMERAA